MSAFAGPSEVTSGLVLALDAGNTKSYAGSGSTWYDISSSKLVGTLTSTTYSSGALSFNGTSSNVSIPTSSTIAITGDLTITAWIKVTNFTGAYRSICGKTVGNLPAPYDYWLEADSGRPTLLRGNGGGAVNYRGTAAPTLGVWQFIAATHASTTATHYLNGSTNGSGALSATSGDGGTDLRVGSRTGNDIWMLGQIAHFTLYNRALSGAEIIQNFNALRGRFGI